MTTEISYLAERQSLVDASRILFANGVMSHSGHANLSARVSEKELLLTIDGQVRDLSRDRLALVDLSGKVIEGNLDPTNVEIITMHSEVYRTRPDVGGIIHTHSPALLAFALASRELPCHYEALLRFGQAVPVPVVPWAPRGSHQSVTGIIDALGIHPDTHAVLLGNHGVLVLGDNPRQAAAFLTVLEEAAGAELLAKNIGGSAEFPAGALEEVRASMARARA